MAEFYAKFNRVNDFFAPTARLLLLLSDRLAAKRYDNVLKCDFVSTAFEAQELDTIKKNTRGVKYIHTVF